MENVHIRIYQEQPDGVKTPIPSPSKDREKECLLAVTGAVCGMLAVVVVPLFFLQRELMHS